MKTLFLICLFSTSAYANPIEPCFVPGMDCAAVVAHEIDQAKKTVLVQAYGFTSTPIEQALIAAHKRGVDVEIILDRSNLTQKWSGLKLMEGAAVVTSIDASHAISHNKIVIIDDAVVITGSFNLTTSAQKHNAENFVVLRNAATAALYTANWRVHQKHSVAP